MYEDGLGYVEQMNQLGASIVLFPTEFGTQKISITGSADNEEEYFVREHGNEVFIPGVPVIEGTRALFSVALGRTGKTTIADIGPLLRRSPDFVQKFIDSGADIELID
jgi:UDP-N-acetylglucosamine enolpyruvyl transferase